jgi:hypothetical protein
MVAGDERPVSRRRLLHIERSAWSDPLLIMDPWLGMSERPTAHSGRREMP